MELKEKADALKGLYDLITSISSCEENNQIMSKYIYDEIEEIKTDIYIMIKEYSRHKYDYTPKERVQIDYEKYELERSLELLENLDINRLITE